MAKFAYSNEKNANTSHALFGLNCGYYPWMSYKNDVDTRFNSQSANKLSAKLRKLPIVN